MNSRCWRCGNQLTTGDAGTNGLCVACNVKLTIPTKCPDCEKLINALQAVCDPASTRTLEQAREIATDALVAHYRGKIT